MIQPWDWNLPWMIFPKVVEFDKRLALKEILGCYQKKLEINLSKVGIIYF